MKKRLIAMLLALSMCIGMIEVPAFAAELDETPAEQTPETIEDPAGEEPEETPEEIPEEPPEEDPDPEEDEPESDSKSDASVTDSAVSQFMTRLYSVCLNREPDAEGLQWWMNELETGAANARTAVYNTILCEEFENRNLCSECFVKILYRACMGREADTDGLNYWVGVLNEGSSRSAVVCDFLTCGEFSNICAEYGINPGEGVCSGHESPAVSGVCGSCGACITHSWASCTVENTGTDESPVWAETRICSRCGGYETTDSGAMRFIVRLYEVCLGREPDLDGLQWWTNELETGATNAKTAVFNVILSEEFKDRSISNEDFVKTLYSACMDREADADGLAYWVDVLNNGGSCASVMCDFLTCSEFSDICAGYGIAAGEDVYSTLEALGYSGTTEVCGITCSALARTLDLTDAKYCDLDEIGEKIQAMPLLTRIILPPHTDYTNEEIDAFYKSLSGIRVIWTVWLGQCGLRTDTTYFCKNTSDRGYVGYLSNKDYQPLRYCTDLVALDLGHGQVSDLSFLEPLTNLRYLILANDCYTDISVLENLTNLYYLELFLNTIYDISVLENLTNLRYLNIGWVSGISDYSVLQRMTWLDYLWAPGNKMTDSEIAAVEAALPNATMHIARVTAYSSTDHGWRQTPGYYEMRDALHMYYMNG